jgi:signal transduction histidine kinase
MVWVAVTDRSAGIEPEDLPHIFDRFWRSEAAKQLQPQGQGIGLPLVKRLVELQGGKIIVESRLGHGTTFQFSLPLA